MANDSDNVIKSLLSAEKCADIFDKSNTQGEKKYESLLVNRITFNPQQSGKNWEGNSKNYLLLMIENDPNISKLTDNADFAALIERLKS